MNRPDPQHALRELRRSFRHPVTWAVLLGITGILAIAGPFGTDDLMRFAPRAAYWGALAVSTYAIGMLTGAILWPWLRGRWPNPAIILAAGLGTGLGATLAVTLLNLAVFGFLPDWTEVPGFAAPIFAIALIVTAVLDILMGLFNGRTGAEARTDAPEGPALLDRLPFDKRGALLALSVEDHYVCVRTDRGEALLLMRLTDAIRETAPVAGLRVHRSHWVALGAVTAARRDGDRAVLTLRDGTEVPASRANVAALRDAGLLAR